MREILSESQRRQRTPLGQRRFSSAARHSSSVSNASIRIGKVILFETIGLFSMPRRQKPVSEMTDKELVRKIFPTPVRKALKKVLAELNSDKPKAKKRKKRLP